MPNIITPKGRDRTARILFDTVASNDSVYQPEERALELFAAHDDALNELSLYQPERCLEDAWALELLEPNERKDMLVDLGFDDAEILVAPENYYDVAAELIDIKDCDAPIVEAFVDLSGASAIEKQLVEKANVSNRLPDQKASLLGRMKAWLTRTNR